MTYGIRSWKANAQLSSDSTTIQGGFLLLGTIVPATGLNDVTTMTYPSWAGKTVRTLIVSQWAFQYTVSVTYPSGVPSVSITSTVAGNKPAICYVFGK